MHSGQSLLLGASGKPPLALAADRALAWSTALLLLLPHPLVSALGLPDCHNRSEYTERAVSSEQRGTAHTERQ